MELTDMQLSATFRSDLPQRVEDSPEGLRHIIQNPETGKFIRLGEFEYFTAQLLDGRTSLEQIKQRIEAKFGGEIETAELAAFIHSLAARGLLNVPGAEAQAPRRPHKNLIQGSPLYLRLRAYDPDRHLNRLEKKLRFCFTRAFVYFAIATIVLAVVIFFANSREILRDVVALLRPETLLAAWLVILGASTVHEYAHALTCKHFGGRVREMGFMLIFFQPALYANVSDAWLFPEKHQRLWVTAAGGFIDLFVWALAILAWRVFAPETTINFIATVIAATAGIRGLFNLNPLIKLDGYYLLSDWLEIPNLRQRATDYAKARLSFDRRRARAAKEACPPRERRILLVYGVLATVFVIWFLSFVVSGIGGWLLDEYQGWGFLAICGFLWLLFGRRLRGLFRAPSPANAENLAR
jgi:hypothetical protein